MPKTDKSIKPLLSAPLCRIQHSPACSLKISHAITHGLIAFATPLPHALQRWMPCIDEINDPYICFMGVLTMQSSCVLLQGPLPGHRHGQNQRIERRVIEALPNQLACRKQNARCIRRQCIQVSDQRRSLLPGHSTVQDKWRRLQPVESRFDCIEVLRAFSQNQHLAPLADSVTHLDSNSLGSCLVTDKMPKDILYACIHRKVDACET